MRGILILGLLVGIVGTAGAEESCGGITTAEGITAIEGARRYRAQHECMMRLAEEPIHEIYGDFDAGVLKVNGRSLCEIKMQAAMEAMDWHVEHLVHPSRDPGFYRYQTNREALIAAYRQWADAKACWRKP